MDFFIYKFSWDLKNMPPSLHKVLMFTQKELWRPYLSISIFYTVKSTKLDGVKFFPEHRSHYCLHTFARDIHTPLILEYDNRNLSLF